MKKSTAFTLVGALLGTLMFSLDQLVVATAIPQIAREFKALSQLSWVFTAYMLTSTVTIPICGKLSDIFGRKLFYLLGIVVFLVGSVLAGISRNMTQLILFAGLQGIGGGAMMVNSVAIIGDIFSPAERGRWQGLNMSMYGLATIGGPLLGGWLADSFSWRWVFFINIPIGIIAIAVMAAFMPNIAHRVKDRVVDYAGALLIAVGLVPLLLAFVWGGGKHPWVSWQILSLLGTAVCALLAFVLVERRAREPILSLSLFRNKVYAISAATIFLTRIGMYGAILFVPLFAQSVIGVSATNSGLILLPMMVGLILASVLAGQVVSLTGKYKILAIIGMIVTVLGMGLFTRIGLHTTNAALTWRMVVLGVGIGATMPIFTITAQSAFGPERLGEITAGAQLFQNVGGTVSTAILGGVMSSGLARQLANIQNEPFLAAMKQLNPAASFKIDANALQGFLSVQGQAQVKANIAQAPQTEQAQLLASFGHLQNTVKSALSYSVDHVYLVSTILMLVALVIVLFLPQIPLRESKNEVFGETGETGTVTNC